MAADQATPDQDGIYTRVTQYEVSVFPGSLRDDPMTGSDVCSWMLTVEDRGNGLWAVMHRRWCLGADGEWDWETRPSGREDGWLKAHRFPLEEALRLARQHAPGITINSMTALEVLARHVGSADGG